MLASPIIVGITVCRWYLQGFSTAMLPFFFCNKKSTFVGKDLETVLSYQNCTHKV